MQDVVNAEKFPPNESKHDTIMGPDFARALLYSILKKVRAKRLLVKAFCTIVQYGNYIQYRSILY